MLMDVPGKLSELTPQAAFTWDPLLALPLRRRGDGNLPLSKPDKGAILLSKTANDD